MAKQSLTRSLYFSERISGAMTGIFDYPLTIVEAPMGYGKTTAVREHLKSTHANVLWQTLHDNSVDNFWNGFCFLFNKMDQSRSQSLSQLGFPNDKVSLQEALKLIQEIKLPKKTVLCIDDYHLVNETEVGNFIELIVVNEIDNLHIVLTGRFIELPNMEELSLKGYLFHITKDAFELMPNDIMNYYKLCGISLKKTEAEKLYTITEGWISALYLLMLNFKEKGSIMTTDNIYKLVESAVYTPFSEDIKDFLLTMCLFDSFTKKQAVHIWGNEEAVDFLTEITRKNAFVNYDTSAGTYYIHSIFSNFLQEIFERKDADYKKNLYQKTGYWYLLTREYLTAMHYFYTAGDFENLLSVLELDKGNSFGNEQKELIIKYVEECPGEIKQRHIAALLVYAMALVTFNEMGLFKKTCEEITVLIQNSSLDPDSVNSLMGELELLASFTRYNDIVGMSKHHKRALELMKKPSVFMEAKGSWTFGSPSVLYMFYRESGKLEQEVYEIKEAMPYYYRLTNGHGMGAEYVMAAEWHFNKGDFESAEITAYKALFQARSGNQPNIAICAMFLLVRLSLIKGDYTHVLTLFKEMYEEIDERKVYMLIHMIDMCKGFVNAFLQQEDQIPEWLTEGDFTSNRLYFPARAFSNIIFGRALLINGEYLKLLGISGQFLGIASIFPNLLAKVYTVIYIAAVNYRIYRRDEAVEAIKQALEMAIPDKLYMPFVENCDYIKPLLEDLYAQGIYCDEIPRILELYKPYQKAVEHIKETYFMEKKPKLTKREAEIAELAAQGFSNKAIGEKLFISQNTVKTQLKNIFQKLDVSSRSLLKQHFEKTI